MRAIQEAVVNCLEKWTGIRTVLDRTRVRSYPVLAVGIREDGTVLIDGGRQAEHTYRLSVTAVSDREREGNGELLSSLIPLLLGGIPLEEGGVRRVLHPLDIRTEGEELSFCVALCVPVPRPGRPGESEPGIMAALHMDI